MGSKDKVSTTFPTLRQNLSTSITTVVPDVWVKWNDVERGTISVIASGCDSAKLNNISATPLNIKILSIAGVSPKWTAPTNGSAVNLPLCSTSPVTFSVEKMVYPSTVNPSNLSQQIYAATYEWTLPLGFTGPGGKTGTFKAPESIAVTSQAGASGVISVRAFSTACTLGGGPFYSNPTSVVVNRTPEAPTFTTRASSFCNSQSITFVASAPNASSYNWSLPDGLHFSDGTVYKSNVSGTQTIVAPATGEFLSTVQVAANYNCTGTMFTSIASTSTAFVGPPTTPTISGGVDRLCSDRTSTYTVNTTGATSYQWSVSSGGSIQGSPTSPSVVVKPTTINTTIQLTAIVSNSCGSRQIIKTITVPNAAPITATLSMTGAIRPYRNSIAAYSISTVAGATNYYWYTDGGDPIMSGQGTLRTTIKLIQGGPVVVYVKASNECSEIIVYKSIYVANPSADPCTGPRCPPDPLRISSESLESPTSVIYPNPVQDRLTIQGLIIEDQTTSITLYNSWGQIVKQANIQDEQYSLSVRNLPNGIYYLQLVNQSGIRRERIVIQH